jgi:hypothetical protein
MAQVAMKPARARKPLQVLLVTLPQKQLRSAPDIGDWQVNVDGSPAVCSCADTGKDISNAAVLLHEFVEAFLCFLHGVKEEEVSAFDRAWFKEEEDGVEHLYDAPGEEPVAPYHLEHVEAEKFERAFVELCGMGWDEHEANCDEVD